MKQLDNLPPGLEIFSNIISYDSAEYLIDQIENAVNEKNRCNCRWGLPANNSPDATYLRRNFGINLSDHAFQNTECNCGIREIEASLGKTMLLCLEEYVNKYQINLTQDEGLIIVKRGDDHVDLSGVDDNPFVNRLVSMHFPLNIGSPIEYMKFTNLNFSVSLSSPAIIMFPSNFLFSYSKNINNNLYEIENFFNDNPSQEYYDSIFKNSIA